MAGEAVTRHDVAAARAAGAVARDEQMRAIDFFLRAAFVMTGESGETLRREIDVMLGQLEDMMHTAEHGTAAPPRDDVPVKGDVPSKSSGARAAAASAPPPLPAAATGGGHGGAGRPVSSEVEGTAARDPRWRVCKELLDTEVTYIAALRTYLEVFGGPLEPQTPDKCATCRDKRGGHLAHIVGAVRGLFGGGSADEITCDNPHCWLDDAQYQRMFQHVRTILQFHEGALLPKLREQVEPWRPESSVGEVMSRYAPFLSMYFAVIQNIEANQRLVDELAASSPAFAQFLAERVTGPRCKGQSLASYLIAPAQRVPRYRLLLEALAKATPPDHPDAAWVRKAVATVSSRADALNADLRRFENAVKLYDAVYEFVPPRLDLIEPHRTLVARGDADLLTPKGGSKAVTLYLMNDAYVVGDRIGITPLHTFNCCVTPLRVFVCDDATASATRAGVAGFAFRVMGRTASFDFVVPTQAGREDWLRHFAGVTDTVVVDDIDDVVAAAVDAALAAPATLPHAAPLAPDSAAGAAALVAASPAASGGIGAHGAGVRSSIDVRRGSMALPASGAAAAPGAGTWATPGVRMGCCCWAVGVLPDPRLPTQSPTRPNPADGTRVGARHLQVRALQQAVLPVPARAPLPRVRPDGV